MNFKKTVAIATAVGALAAISVPAMALENEFHGMFKSFSYLSNVYSGGGGFRLAESEGVSRYSEQRARIQYTAKASDNLKLVTHFELDSRWGGNSPTNTGKYGSAASTGAVTGGNVTGAATAAIPATGSTDAGVLDADGISIETKNVYLDFNCPITGSNVKVGIQPFNDAYQGTFGNFDGSGVQISRKYDAFTGTVGYFRAADTNVKSATDFKKSTDIYILDGKYAVNKDLTVGANYYNISRDTGVTRTAGTVAKPNADLLNAEFTNMVGANVSAMVGPAALTAAFGYQFGDYMKDVKLKAYGGNATAKVAVGPGKVNLSALYLSGQKDSGDDATFWQTVSPAVNYFNASNMWLLIRNGAQINTSTSPSGGDVVNKGLGMMGVFAGYEGTLDKLFYGANVGYAQTAEKMDAKSALGTELNATVGYKLYDNLSISGTAAYLILGDGLKSKNAADLLVGLDGAAIGVAKAQNPFLTNIQVSYTF